MEKFFQNYYLGIIRCSSEYYREVTKANKETANAQNRIRWINGTCWDPFVGTLEEVATQIGEPTLLYKEGNKYYDLRFSLYPDELNYEIGKENDFGFTLQYVEPFLDWYPSISTDMALQAIGHHLQNMDLLLALPFLIEWNRNRKRYDIHIQNEEILYQFFYHSFHSAYRKEKTELNDYYLGIITVDSAHIFSFLADRPEILDFCTREEMQDRNTLERGIPTVLYKKDNIYHDIFYNRYPNDLKYEIGIPSRLGITLEMVEPFLNRYEKITMEPLPSFASMCTYLEENTVPYLLYREDGYSYPLIEVDDKNPLYNLQEEWFQTNKVYSKK